MKEGYKKTELGRIPDEWNITLLSEISDKIGDGLHGTPEYDENGEYYFINGNNLVNGNIVISSETKKVSEKEFNKNKKELNNNTILLSLNGTIGNIAYYKEEKIILGKSSGYITLSNSINKDFIYYFLQINKVVDYFNKELTGSTIKNLSLNTLRNTKIILPTELEQQKIAEILSTVDSQIEYTDKLIKKTKGLKKGLMQRLLTKGIGHKEFKKSEIGEIPVGWKVKPFNEAISVLTDYHSNGSYKNLKENVNLLDAENYAIMVRITNISKDATKEFKYIDKKAYNFLEKSKLHPNDIVMNKISDAGSVYLVPDFNKPMSLAMNLFLIRTNNNIFYYYYLSFKEQYVKSFASGTATTTITKDDVRNILVPYFDKEEQNKIANILSSIDNQIEEYKNKKNKLEQLKKGLMQQLLTGKIRVK